MSTSSFHPLSIYLSSTKACAIMQCCILWPRSREFSRRKSGVHYFSVSRCIGQLKLHWNRSLTHSPCNAKWLKSKRQRTSAQAMISKMPSSIDKSAWRSNRIKIVARSLRTHQEEVREICKGERLRLPSNSLNQEMLSPSAA